MFGSFVDYWLLRPLTHRRYIATEEELDALAEIGQPFDAQHAKHRLEKWNWRLENRIPLRRDLRYLDVGCGHGDLTIAFAMAGCGRICGIDIVSRCITRAKSYPKKTEELGERRYDRSKPRELRFSRGDPRSPIAVGPISA